MATPYRACESCGATFPYENPRGRKRRFCDARCRSRSRRQRVKQQAAPTVGQPFATAIQAALTATGQTLRAVAAALDELSYDLSPSTLSQWSHGNHLPPDSDVIRCRLYALEQLAAVPSGSLVGALVQTWDELQGPEASFQRRLRALKAPVGSHPMDQARQVLLERIAGLDRSDVRSLVQVEQTERYVIGPERMPLRSDMTLQVVALVDGLDRYWHVYAYDPQAPVVVIAQAGCTRRLVLDDLPPVEVAPGVKYQLAATELRFERPLAAGEEYAFDLSMLYASESREPLPDEELRRFVTTPATRRLNICLSFDPAARPRKLYRRRWSLKPGGEPIESEQVLVGRDGSAPPLIKTFPRPAGYGFTWEWPDKKQKQPS
jgi:hypothetical protein